MRGEGNHKIPGSFAPENMEKTGAERVKYSLACQHEDAIPIKFVSYAQKCPTVLCTFAVALRKESVDRNAYPIYYDVEYEKYHLNCGKAQNTAIIKTALETLEAGGYYAAVYCSRDFFINYTDLSGLANFDKWEAAYTKTDTATVQNGLWQYSSKNALGIAGFGNSLDCDVCYRDYPAIMEKNGLNGYTKTAQAAQPKATEYMVTAGPMSAGDKNTIKAQAEALGLPVTVKEC